MLSRQEMAHLARRCSIFLIAGATLYAADTLQLRDGGVLSGQFEGGDIRLIRFIVGDQIGDQIKVFSISSAASVTFDDPPTNFPSPITP